MANATVTLETGLTVGDEPQTEAEIRINTVADMLDAAEAAEKLVRTPDGEYRLMINPDLMGVHLLRLQIVRIGSHKGPLTMTEIRRLTLTDLEELQRRALALESASVRAATPGEAQPGKGAGTP